MVGVIAVRVSVTVLALVLWTAPALAQRGGGHRHGPIRAQVMPGRPVMPSHPIARPPSLVPGPGHGWHHHHHGGFGKRGFVGVGGGPIVLYSPPVYSSPVYGDPASYYSPPPAPSYSYVPAYPPAAYDYTPSLTVTPPTPTVIEHPTGRYELRGDGLTAPYRWVWVPHPPSTPPPSPPPAVAEPAPSSRSATSSPNEPTPRRSKLYRWKDDEGVMHWTDDVTTVPPELRSKAEVRSY